MYEERRLRASYRAHVETLPRCSPGPGPTRTAETKVKPRAALRAADPVSRLRRGWLTDASGATESSGMFLALEIQRHSFTNEVLQRISVNLVRFLDVNDTPDLPVKAGVE